jgi:type II secretory ATPase GspE/PulE/Tfp pilus assembly ATPase PilB-like protein
MTVSVNNHKPLTLPGEKFALNDREMLNNICLLPDGTLFVTKNFQSSGKFLSWKGRLKRNGVKIAIKLTTEEGVRQQYKRYTASQETTVSQMSAQDVFRVAVKYRASDIHIRVSEKKGTEILMRVDGLLRPLFDENKTFAYGEAMVNTIYQSMCDVSDSTLEKRKPQDARVSDPDKMPLSLEGIRVATTPTVDGLLMVLRLLYKDTGDLSLDKMGLLDSQIDSIELMKRTPTGLNLISGPTGSGKSTLLAAILSDIYEETEGQKHIITVEDPPEYPIEGAVQTPVENAETEEERSRKFQKAISAALRLDPDIIMIGEIRDTPSATLAVRAAMTGHQVWATLHTNSSLGIIHRLRDLGVPDDLLSDPSVLRGLVNQRLVSKLCPHCKKKVTEATTTGLSDKKIKRLYRMPVDIDKIFIKGNGCDKCDNKGLKGRVGIDEVFITDESMMQYIKEGNTIGLLNYIRNEKHSKFLLEAAIEKVKQGVLDPFEAESVVGPLNMFEIEADHKITDEELSDVS